MSPATTRRGLATTALVACALTVTPGAWADARGLPTPGGVLRAAAPAESCDPEVTRYVAEEPQAFARLGVEQTWQLATGAGVLVAVVDSGIDPSNAHLTGALEEGLDLVGTEGDPRGWADPAGHGTAVAGQIAARPVEGSGLVGLAPDARLLPVRVYLSTDDRAAEAGDGVRTDRIAEGIRAAANRGAQVINVSLSSTQDDPELRAAVRSAHARGALVVASAGNRLTTTETEDSPRYPAAYPEVLAVSAVGPDDEATTDAIHGHHVDIAAPGTDVLTTFHGAGDCLLAGAGASTSFATAYVSAAAALIAERYPDELPDQWAHRLMATAARPHPEQRDDARGWGVVRPWAALAFVDDGSAPGPPSPVHDAPDTVAAPPAALALGERTDLTGPTRRAAGWWVVGGVAALLGAALLSARRPRGRGRAAR